MPHRTWRSNRLTRALDDNLQVGWSGVSEVGTTSTCRIATLESISSPGRSPWGRPGSCCSSHHLPLPSPLVISPNFTEYFETMSMPSIKIFSDYWCWPYPIALRNTVYTLWISGWKVWFYFCDCLCRLAQGCFMLFLNFFQR
jgi:hypothetical protein